MIYFDTAYIIKCYINEIGSEEVRTLAVKHDAITCCEFGRMELSTALHRSLREGKIGSEYFDTVHEQLRQDEEDHLWTWLPLSREIMEGVTTMFGTLPATTYLRTGDAIHLKCAATNNVSSLYTNDTHMIEAAQYVDIEASNVIVDTTAS